jgi:hypothetical protein
MLKSQIERESNSWRAGSQRVSRERRTDKNSYQTRKFSFTRAGKLLIVVVLRARKLLFNQMFVNKLDSQYRP